tara:strand:- start:117 stop:1013 length:897 start_codon:yes stop_codon:yes gene_type:complete
MYKKFFKFGILFSLLFTLITSISKSIASNNDNPSKVEVDLLAKQIQDSNSKKRVVALTSLSADIVERIDSNILVGIPGSKLFMNNPRFSKKVIISRGRTPPQLEKILKLQPDLVIGSKGFHEKTLKALRDLGIETLSVEIKDFDDLESLINNLLIFSGKDIFPFKSVMNSCYMKNHNFKPRVIALVSLKPLLSPNSNSWAGNLLERFNIENLSAKLESKSQFKGYVNLSYEWIVTNKPDHFILVETRNNLTQQFKQDPVFKKLKAFDSGSLTSFDYYGLVNPGSLESINNACKKLSVL